MTSSKSQSTDRHPGRSWVAGAAEIRRVVLASFLITFLLARIAVYLIMSRRIPDLYLHLGGTHVHHLNYGVFALSIAGLLLLFTRPEGRALGAVAMLYGAGLALTFDEFGMWLHLGGSYWQRSSFDAVVIIAALLGLMAYPPKLASFTARRMLVLVVILGLTGAFFLKYGEYVDLMIQSGAGDVHRLESEGPR